MARLVIPVSNFTELERSLADAVAAIPPTERGRAFGIWDLAAKAGQTQPSPKDQKAEYDAQRQCVGCGGGCGGGCGCGCVAETETEPRDRAQRQSPETETERQRKP